MRYEKKIMMKTSMKTTLWNISNTKNNITFNTIGNLVGVPIYIIVELMSPKWQVLI